MDVFGGFIRDGTLFAVSFDLKRLQVTGTPTPIADDVFTRVNPGDAGYSVSDGGTFVYFVRRKDPGRSSARVALVFNVFDELRRLAPAR